jgi:hypothetical protein
MGRGHPGHAFQRLDAALRLACLGRLGPEARHETLHVRDLALLSLEQRLLLGKDLRTLQFKTAVVARIEGDPLLLDMRHVIHDPVQERTVMGDQQQGARIGREPLLQPEHRVQVQVVGGLVEQQQVRAAHERLGQVQAHAPATREIRHRALQVRLAEAQAVEQAPGTTGCPPGVDTVQTLVHPGHARPVTRSLGPPKLRLERAQLRVTIQDVVQGGTLRGRGLLRHAGDDPFGGVFAGPLVRRQFAAYQCKQAGLAGTVGARQADAPAGMYGKVRSPEQDPCAAAQGKIREFQHGRGV